MTSMWSSTLASLDDSLAALDAIMLQFEAGTPVDMVQAADRLKSAAESSRNLRTFVLSQMPEADWQDRSELRAVLEAIDVQRRRSQLQALATELERGDIVHRRAARVTQLNELRAEAIEELQKMAAADAAPPDLPGPGADRWMEWACALQEPDDTASLETLRAGFPWLDEFVATLEPGMWVAATPPQVAAPAPAASMAAAAAASAAPAPSMTAAAATAASPALTPIPAQPIAEPVAVAADDVEQRRARLLALATELERGEVVHHRAIRVTQVNQLRDQAIQELRFQAVVAREPATLPGPEAEKWVPWACSLQEPDDAAALQTLRDGFVHLDQFVANLEPDMWVPAGPPRAAVAAVPAESPRETSPQEKPRAEKPKREKPAREKTQAASKPVEPAEDKPALVTLISSKIRGSSDHLPPKLVSFWRARWRILLPGLVLLLVLLGAMQWQLRRTHASSLPVKAVEPKAPDVAATAPATAAVVPNTTPANLAAKAPDVKDKDKDKGAKPKDATADAKPSPPPPEKQVTLLNDANLRTPQAMPKTAAPEEASNGAGAGIAGALPNTLPASLTNIEKNVPAQATNVPTQKIKVSSGVAQGQLIHQVAPVYPDQAKLAQIRGTVVVQAVVGKDGSVQKVKALRGPPILIQSAVDAVKQWRYKPFSVNGEPAEADIEISLKFSPYD